MQFQYKSTPAEFGTLLGCLRSAKKSGIEVDIDGCNSCLIEHKTLEVNAFHQSDEVILIKFITCAIAFFVDSCVSFGFDSGKSKKYRIIYRR